jgi:DNA-binding response OmpR family regulator
MRVLIVEDEFLAGVMLEEDLRAAGWTTIGPYPTLSDATEAAEHQPFDVAVLDINLDGEMVYPLADQLTARGVPFIFLSGYTTRDLPERFSAVPKVSKPYSITALRRELDRIALA